MRISSRNDITQRWRTCTSRNFLKTKSHREGTGSDDFFVTLQKIMMTYIELLQQKEWFEKCNEILSRDHYICRDCGMFGFHNGSFIRLDNLEILDSIFSRWTLKEMSPSSFLKDIPLKNLIDYKRVPFRLKEKTNHLFIYECKLLESANVNSIDIYELNDFPCTRIICEKEIKSSNARVGGTYAVRHKSNEDLRDELIYIEFEEKLSDNIYLSIENVNYGIVASITSGNKHLAFCFPKSCNEIKGLNIHHTHYVLGKLPWDYSNEYLITLCKDCHQERHKYAIPCYSSVGEQLGYLKACDRCGGSGYLPQYKHVQNGICFKCGGEGSVIND